MNVSDVLKWLVEKGTDEIREPGSVARRTLADSTSQRA